MYNYLQKKRILFVEQWPGIGGAITNVLYPMITNLDRNRYEPFVLFYWPHPYAEKFEALGIKTMVFEESKSWEHVGVVNQLQKSNLVKTLQGDNGRSSAAYHAVGSYVRLSYYLPQIMQLVKIIRANEIDLVHLNSDPTRHGREVIIAAKLAGAKTLCYAQNFSEFQAVDRQIARLIDRYVFCSQAIGRHCISLGGATPDQGCTIYPGVPDTEKWSQARDRSKLRREFGWSDQDFVLGNIGRLVSWKGQHIFLKALAEVKQHLPNVKGLIVGGPLETSTGQNGQSPTFYEELLALTKALDLESNVTFAGFRSDIPEILASVDVFVHSSSEPEPFATAVIEALMAGCPVIATNAGGMPEMIANAQTGMLCDINNPKSMAQAMLIYYYSQTQTQRIAKAGQQRAAQYLTAQRHINEFHTLYESILA